MDDLIRTSWYWLILIGLLAGTLSGALGVGSGIVVVPALVIAMAVPQKVAQGTCLAVMVPMALMGAIRYYVNPDIKVNMGVVLLMVPFAIIGANIGATLAAMAPALILKRCFGGFIIIVGAKMLLTK